MKSIKTITTHTLIIKKSEFITTLIPCNDLDEADDLIKDFAKTDATHNCVAYIIGPHEKANDDGEPSGTAGLPMLNVLKRQGLSNIIAIVTRYFGGIKLGAGGLTRAYTNAVAQTLKEAEIVEKELVKKYRLDIDYHYAKQVDYLIKARGYTLLDTTYDTQVHYTLFLPDEGFLDELKDLTNNTFTFENCGMDYMSVK